MFNFVLGFVVGGGILLFFPQPNWVVRIKDWFKSKFSSTPTPPAI